MARVAPLRSPTKAANIGTDEEQELHSIPQIKLENIQCQAMVCMAFARNNTPTARLEIITGIQPVDMVLERESTICYLGIVHFL